MANDPDYKGTSFPSFKNDYSKIKKNNNICINAF